jgi:TPR repeat protein
MLPKMSESQLAAAQSAFESGDDKKAISILEPLCDSGVVEAMAMLGAIYQTRAEKTHEGERAVVLLSRAAEQGSGLAAHNLATAFVTGLPGVPANLEESRKYLKLAKALGVKLLPGKFYE